MGKHLIYLGIYSDTQLKFDELKCIRLRIEARLATLSYIAFLKEGASIIVQNCIALHLPGHSLTMVAQYPQT